MLKFIRGKGHQPSAERLKLQRELFAFRKTVQHGFPNKPTALAWDSELRLLCIGTGSGAVKVFGRPGVEFYGQHAPTSTNNNNNNGSINGASGSPPAVIKLVCLPGAQGRLVSLCDDNSLHLWEINKSSIVEVKSLALEGKLKKISTICVAENGGGHLLLGTEGGNIYLLDLSTFTMASDIIYQDVVMQNVPEDYKVNPGAVECIAEQPGRPNNILIGYAKGLMVLWSRDETRALQTFISPQQLESICWHQSNDNSDDHHQRFTSSHNDGSYTVWDIASGSGSGEPVTTYGPYPCKAITKIEVKMLRGNELLVFAGGTPRASCADKYTVTVINGDKHVAFDFTSRVIDFFTITPLYGSSEPDTLIVLTEEELVAIDLIDSSWRMLSPPYLVSLHASAVTCAHYVGHVPDTMWRTIKDAGRTTKSQKMYSDREWPINGGFIEETSSTTRSQQLLLTGHEDGTVRFWDASGVALTPLYKYSTAALFTSDDEHDNVDEAQNEVDDEDDWPPLRKTGVFDPYSDDPRLAIKKVTMCPVTGTLVAAGTAGHIVVAQLSTDDITSSFQTTTMNIVCDRDGFVWKGHKQLNLKTGKGANDVSGNFKALSVLQLHPPAAVTCIALNSEWKLISAGTAHGLAIYDYYRNKPVLVKCTLNPNDLSGAGDTPISRRKSFKKSLRESFRRLRKGRSTRRPGTGTSSSGNTITTSSPRRVLPTVDSGGDEGLEAAKPVERQVEARPVDDSLGSMVRCLYFAKTFIINEQNTTATLWSGTNNGTVYVFTIMVPPNAGNKRETDDVTCQLGKEIQLKHRAPVIAIAVLDGSSKPLPEYPDQTQRKIDYSQAHRVLIASEEQFKIFTLPSLRPWRKYRLTAKEGSRLRRMSFAEFSCKIPTVPNDSTSTVGTTDEIHKECCLLCLTNLGDCLIWSLPELIKQLNAAAIRREDINGISSLVFTPEGEALYLHSSSELQRITVNANYVTAAHCYLKLSRPRDNKQSPSKATDDDAANDTTIEQAAQNGEDHDDEDMDDAKMLNGNDKNDITISSSSVGDITIDSVKDHLANSSLGALSNSDQLPEDPPSSNKSNNSTIPTATTNCTTRHE